MRRPEKRQLPVSALIVDPNVQRTLDRNRASGMAETLDLAAIGVITVSHRGNGSYHVVDGQHRVEALRLAGGDGEKVDCRVFDGLTVEDEAKLFRLLNNTKQLQAIDKFRVRVVEGEPVAVEIEQILNRHGWKLQAGATAGSFSAVTAIERVWSRDQEAVERTIVTLTRAFGHESVAVHGSLVEGIGLVYARYGDAVDDRGMADRLARYPAGAARLIGAARGIAATYRWTLAQGVADLAVGLYNSGRKTKALPPWRAS